jgi:hypothetical protein
MKSVRKHPSFPARIESLFAVLAKQIFVNLFHCVREPFGSECEVLGVAGIVKKGVNLSRPKMAVTEGPHPKAQSTRFCGPTHDRFYPLSLKLSIALRISISSFGSF